METSVREPSLSDVGREVARLLRRARRRFLAVLGLGTLLTLGAAGFVARKPVLSEVKTVVRVTDVNDQSVIRAAWTTKDLRARVTEVAFSSENLMALMQRLGLARPRPGRRFDPQDALDDFRKSLDVEVVQNQVMSLFAPEDRPRSAYVVIKYKAVDRDEAVAVTKELAALVATTSGLERLRALQQAVRQAGGNAATTRREIDTLIAVGTRIDANQGAAIAVRHTELEKNLESARQRLRQLEAERAHAAAALRAERNARGIELAILEPNLGPPPMPKSRRILIVALATVLFGFPLCALLVGAFSRAIDDAADLAQLGLACLGRVSAEPYAGTGRVGPGLDA